MAIDKIVVTCDGCGYENEEHVEEERDLLGLGWFVLQGPDIILGGDDRAYCSKECLAEDAARL